MKKNESVITSSSHLAVKHVVKLHQKKGRTLYQQCLVEGARTFFSCIKAGWKPINVYVTNKLLLKIDVPCPHTVVSETVMEKISTQTTPAGLVAIFHLPPQPCTTLLRSGIVCANMTDPGNMGTLIRSCVAFNQTSIVIVKGCDPWSPKVIQATAGTIAHASIFIWSWKELLQYKKNITLCALVPQGGRPLDQAPLKNSLFVIGNEAHGICSAWLDTCDTKITVSMHTIESLNAAIAGSIALYTRMHYANTT